LWIRGKQFWQVDDDIYVEGDVFQVVDHFEFCFPVLQIKFDKKFMKISNLNYVNDYIDVLFEKIILIKGFV
jgi:hypothetical protein